MSRSEQTHDIIMGELVYYRAEFSYDPGNQDEENYISIMEGDILEVNPAEQSIEGSVENPQSWLSGKNQRTGQQGFFPGTYVKKCMPPVPKPVTKPVPKPRPPKGSQDSGFFESPQCKSTLVRSAF